MQYVLLIYGDERTECRSQSTPDGVAAIGLGAYLLAEHRLRGSHAATTVRSTPGGVVVADGPFTDSAEPLSALCVVELRDLDDALVAGKLLARSAAGVEIRPVWYPR